MYKDLDSRHITRRSIKLLAFLALYSVLGAPLSALASVTGPSTALDPAVVWDTPAYEISPATGVLGNQYEVTVTRKDCLADSGNTDKQIKNLRLYAPAGSGITVVNLSQTDCRLSAKISIDPHGPLGAVELWLVKDGAKAPVPEATVRFNITSIPQGPTPTGKGVVDVFWSVLPDKIVKDNFGTKVAREFYCIDAEIGNDSGFDLQLSSMGFTLPTASGMHRLIPTTGYRTVRGSLEAFGDVSPRKFVLSSFDVLGPLLTGFIPFFHVISHKANFSESINIISNPVEKGLKSIWPDLLPTELDRLADQTFRDDVSTKTVLPNNVQSRVLTFVPKRLVFPNKPNQSSPGAKDPKNVQDVMDVLGEMVIVGREIEYVNRIRVVNTPFGTSVTDHSISGKVTDGCNTGVMDVEIKLAATGFVERTVKTDKDGNYSFPNVPDGRTYTVTAKLGNAQFSSTSPATFTLNDTKTDLDFSTSYLIKGTVKTKDKQPFAEPITVEISGGGLSQAATITVNDSGDFLVAVPVTGATPTFQVKLVNLTKYTTPDASSWKCDHRDVSFELTKK
ncbi:MAG TPA: carboxypeptidase-like regulatory domain-containing protein [Pyrinomonadaceae bacterium]|nr:carboxypeptidase-like regulatory domain-containing protein [Pyrinomonadaceae bacterium]